MTEQELMLLAALNDKGSGIRSPEVAGGVGSFGGALAGLAAGQILHPVGRGIGHLRGTNNRFKPGIRLAGSLIGSILGGELGRDAREKMLANSEEARLLAAEAAGTTSDADRIRMQLLLADQYGKMGVA